MEYCYVNFLAKFIKQACALAVLGAVFLVQAQENASTTIPVFYYDKPDQMLSILKTAGLISGTKYSGKYPLFCREISVTFSELSAGSACIRLLFMVL